MSFAFRTVLDAENVIFGIQQLYADKDSAVTHFLKKIFRLLLLPQVEVSDCFFSDFIPSLPNDRWVEQFCDYFPEHYINAGSNFPPPIWSECSTSSFSSTKVCELFHTQFKALVDSALPNVFVQETVPEKKHGINPTPKCKATIHEDLKISNRRKRFLRLKGTCLTWVRGSNLLNPCHINFYQTQTFISFTLPFSMPLFMCSFHGTKDNPHYSCELVGACGLNQEIWEPAVTF